MHRTALVRVCAIILGLTAGAACSAPPASTPTGLRIVVDTSLIDGTTVTMPLRGEVDVTIDWGDGSTTTATECGDGTHTYATDTRATIVIDGRLSAFGGAAFTLLPAPSGYDHAEAIVVVRHEDPAATRAVRPRRHLLDLTAARLGDVPRLLSGAEEAAGHPPRDGRGGRQRVNAQSAPSTSQ